MPGPDMVTKLTRYVKKHGKLPHPDYYHQVGDLGAAVRASIWGIACFVCGEPIAPHQDVSDGELGIRLHKAPCYQLAQEVLAIYKQQRGFGRIGREWVRTYLLKERLRTYQREADERLYSTKYATPHGPLMCVVTRRRRHQ